MNMGFLKYLLFFVIDFCIFCKFGMNLGIIGLAIIIFRILRDVGYLRNVTFAKGSIFEGIAFLKDYKCSFAYLEHAFKDASNMIDRFNLKEKNKEFYVIAIYYDILTTKEDEMKCSIGIYQKNIGFEEKQKEELEQYCRENGYNKFELPTQSSLYSSWEISTIFNKISMFLGIRTFFASFKANIKNADFIKSYKLKEEKCNTVIQIIEHNKNITFSVPKIDETKFHFYAKDK